MNLTMRKKSLILSSIIVLLATLIGLISFIYPFFVGLSANQAIAGQEHQADAPLLFFVLVFAVIAVIFSEFSSKKMNSKVVAILGVIVASGAVLRVVPLPLGASVVFLLVIMAGFCFGARFGFLSGALTIFVSSFLSGGFGPWVPFQMLATGWVGATAAFIPKVDNFQSDLSEQKKLNYKARRWLQLGLLCLFGVLWGYAFGILMNLWFWPYISGQGKSFFAPNLTAIELTKRYFVFYITTSFVWDSARAVGNFFLILFLGLPLLKIFKRFKKHTSIEIIEA